MTVIDAYREVNSKLAAKFGVSEAAGMTKLIFDHFGHSRTSILVKPEQKLDETEYGQMIRITGELFTDRPLQYILGYSWFGDLKILVNESVLIPRPETEELVDRIIKQNDMAHPAILDIGTGSGCIAISLKKLIPGATVFATDVSAASLSLAMQNADNNRAEIKFLEDDILKPSNPGIPGKIDIIVSNPPYVRNSEKKTMAPNVLDFEPHMALFVDDKDPLVFYRAIRDFSLAHLKPGGLLYLEINENLGKETAALFDLHHFTGTKLVKDIHGRFRFIKTIRK